MHTIQEIHEAVAAGKLIQPQHVDRLFSRITALENAIRWHRDQKADDRCIEDDDSLYAALGDGIQCDRRVGCKEEMLKNCARFIERRCEGGHWPNHRELLECLRSLERAAQRHIGIGQRPSITAVAQEEYDKSHIALCEELNRANLLLKGPFYDNPL